MVGNDITPSPPKTEPFRASCGDKREPEICEKDTYQGFTSRMQKNDGTWNTNKSERSEFSGAMHANDPMRLPDLVHVNTSDGP
jgi:hypothetical protein